MRLLSLFCAAWLLLAGCDEDSKCEFQGRTLSPGESVIDEARSLRCTCTAQQLTCVDAPSEAGIIPTRDDLDAGETDGPRPVDMGRVSDAQDLGADATDVALIPPDMGSPPPDRGVEIVDARPPAPCPEAPPHDARCESDGQTCAYGDPVTCCGDEHPVRERCTCVEGRFACEDFEAVCAEAHAGERCLRVEQVCGAWLATRRDQDDRDWEGNIEACDPADISPEWRAKALGRLNAYRAIAGLHTVENSPALDAKAQGCALMFNAASRVGLGLTHMPSPDFPCYTDDAAEAAEASLLDTRPAVAAMPDYMVDPGQQNFGTMPHRIWVLANVLGPVGIGSTNEASCLYVHNGRVGSRRDPQWVAWPSPGPFPFDASYADMTGWTVQSSFVNLSSAELRVSVDGVPRQINTRTLHGGGGAGWALAFIPVGWRSEAGTTYHIDAYDERHDEILLEYDVEMIDCEEELLP